MVRYLAGEFNASADVAAANGKTALMHVADGSHLEMIRYLAGECNAAVDVAEAYLTLYYQILSDLILAHLILSHLILSYLIWPGGSPLGPRHGPHLNNARRIGSDDERTFCFVDPPKGPKVYLATILPLNSICSCP